MERNSTAAPADRGKAMLHRFDEHRARLEALVDGADAWLGAVDQHSLDLARLRWELTRALTEFQMFKHRAILDPLLRRGTPAQARAARAVKAACVAFGEEWRTYVLRWSALGSAGLSCSYRCETQAITARLRASLAQQRRAVAALLADAPAAADR